VNLDVFVQGALALWGAIIPVVIRVNRRRWQMPGMDVTFLLTALLILFVFVALALGPQSE
jgi:hypothetical protein